MKKSKGLKIQKQPKGQTAFGFVERCEDLPLFSGCPPRVQDSPFNPKLAARQVPLFGPPKLEDLQQRKV